MKTRQNTNDHDIILQYQAGDKTLLYKLVKRYHKQFCEKAYWITKDKVMAKDIAQESWIRIMDNLQRLKNPNSFKSWALRIVYTKAIDAIKKRNKENRYVDSDSIIDSVTEIIERTDNPIHLRLLKAIHQLPPGKQAILRLFYTEEYSIAEISGFLNIPIGTVKSRLFKAREKLKSTLKNKDNEK